MGQLSLKARAYGAEPTGDTPQGMIDKLLEKNIRNYTGEVAIGWLMPSLGERVPALVGGNRPSKPHYYAIVPKTALNSTD